MKRIAILLIITLFGLNTPVFSQSKLENALKVIIDAFKGENYKMVNITTQTLTVNSTSNATWSGGKSRGAFKFTLPEGTKKYAVRVTVIPVKSNFQYEDDESFYSLIQKGNAREVASPQNYGIDFFFFDRSYDADAFLGRNNFKALWVVNKTNSFIESRVIAPGNYWIGINNYNELTGLKAIIEVVAFGTF